MDDNLRMGCGCILVIIVFSAAITLSNFYLWILAIILLVLLFTM